MVSVTDTHIAYIDGANLHLAAEQQGVAMDYKKLRIWLKDKFSIHTAYIFLGYIEKYQKTYDYLKQCGFKIIFKEVVYDANGKAKGNCDAHLVLQATQDFYEKKYSKMLLVSSDGDFAPLLSFAKSKNALLGVLSPYSKDKCSLLIKKLDIKIYYLIDQKSKIQK